MTIKIEGSLEIDPDRGVIYFHSKEGYTALRICQLPVPIPNPKWDPRARIGTPTPQMLDITHMFGVSWKREGGDAPG